MAYDPMMGEDWQEGLQAAVGHLEDGRRADAERLLRDLPATGPEWLVP